jgi:pimeloyl-ACP methyl ester carboxylesterase
MSSNSRTNVRTRDRQRPSQTALRLARAAMQATFAVSDELGASLAERLFTSPRRHAHPAREQAVLATGRPFELDVELKAPRWRAKPRRTIAAWRWGCGPTVLLVHGWEGRGAQLGELVAPLNAAGLGVVAFDAPGHGDSAGDRLYLTDYADTLAAAVRQVGPVHAVVAHSYGAAAWLLARARAASGRVALPAGWPEHTVAIAPNAIVEDAIARFAATIGLDEPERRAFERHLATSAGLGLPDLSLDKLVAGPPGELLVVHDCGDREVPFVHAERLAAAWPAADVLVTQGLGHRRVLRDPEVIRQVVAFCSNGLAPPASDLARELDRLIPEQTTLDS